MGFFSNRSAKKPPKETPSSEAAPVDLQQTLHSTVSLLPPQQEADAETQRLFLGFLQKKKQRFDGFPTSWTPSIFQQFYEAPLCRKDTKKVLPEGKAYLSYFICRFSSLFSPCLDFAARLERNFTYGEILQMFSDIDQIEKALDMVYRLENFSDTAEAADAVTACIFQVYRTVESDMFYEQLQKRLCHAEVAQIHKKYDRRRLPLLTTEIFPLQQALDQFAAAYDSLLAGEQSAALAQSVRIKILPILNELTAYAQTHFQSDSDSQKLPETIAAVEAITKKLQRLAEAQRLEEQVFQLDVNLELLTQLSKDL